MKRNEFVYRKVRAECAGKSDDWLRQGINEVLAAMTKQINKTNKAPPSEQLVESRAHLRR